MVWFLQKKNNNSVFIDFNFKLNKKSNVSIFKFFSLLNYSCNALFKKDSTFFYSLLPSLNNLKLQIIKKKKTHHLFSILVSPFFNHFFLPIVVISGSNVSSFLKLGKKNKNSSVSQMLACFFIRKYIILLHLFRFDLFLKNTVCTFPVFWRYIKMPTNDIYWNPMTLGWVFDVKVSRDEISLLSNSLNLEDWLNVSGWYFLSEESIQQCSWAVFKKDFLSLNFRKKSKWIFRYTLNWVAIQLQSGIQFGFKKNTKSKRLPKRHTKKMISKLQTRFWLW